MEDKELNVDLNNLKKEDFLQMANYIQHLEAQIAGLQSNVEQLKGYCITLKTQRVSSDNKVIEMQARMMNMQAVQSQPISVKLNDDITLVNPEQYREKKQF
jgi:hypothetical protein